MATATVDGFQAAFQVGTGFAVAGAILALVLVKQQKGEPAAAEAVAMH